MRALLLAVLVICLGASCSDPFPGYSRLGEGLYFKIHRFTDDTLKPRAGDMVKFVIRLDELNVEDENKTFIMPFDPDVDGFQSELSRFHIGDSIGLIFSSRRMKEEFDMRLPVGVDYHHVEMEMVDVIRRRDWERNMAAERKLHLDIQQVAIDSYVESSEFEFEERMGMLVSEDPRVEAKKIPSDQSLYLYYVSRTMDGRTIELNVEPESYISYSLGMQGQVINGLETIIPTLHLNETAELIIPFDLAFGVRGVPGVVEPYTPLRYTLMVSDKPMDVPVDFD